MNKPKEAKPYVGNPYDKYSDEFYIDEIIGIDEIRYKDLVKEWDRDSATRCTNASAFFIQDVKK
jgi:hypothetical protein